MQSFELEQLREAGTEETTECSEENQLSPNNHIMHKSTSFQVGAHSISISEFTDSRTFSSYFWTLHVLWYKVSLGSCGLKNSSL